MYRCLPFLSYALFPALAAAADPVEFFEMKVRPVLAKHCYSCHTATHMGGLTVDSREALLKGGGRGPAIAPGKSAESLLMTAVRHADPKLKMPPSGKLSESEIADLASWIDGGAAWGKAAPAAKAGSKYTITEEQRHWWAFQPVRKPEPPRVKNERWISTPIDRFVLAALERERLKPNAAASKRDLIRRVYYDLIGLPPAAADIEKFEADKSSEALAKVVDELLASPAYGERWGRYWLDVARYSDDKLNSTQDEPYANAWRYRDWVIGAFNDDMPYDLFLKAQIAGDQIEHPDKAKLVAGLGFYALSPQFQDDRVDATTRGVMGITVACAQCHDHKFDPIPTKDYYALLGVFTSTELGEFPLAPADVVERYKQSKKGIEDQRKEIDEFLDRQANDLAEILAAQTARFIESVRKGEAAPGLDGETYERWKKYLTGAKREHPFLDDWDKDSFSPAQFQETVIALNREKKEIDKQNMIRLGGSEVRRDLANADLLSLARDRYFLWRDLFGAGRFEKFDSGVLYHKPERLERFLSGAWKQHLIELRAELDRRTKAMPDPYPYYHTIQDVKDPKNTRIQIRGSRDNLGDEAPRAFLSVFAKGDPEPFRKGSGRLELAEAIGNRENPLTARVWANRVWGYHFGKPLVATPSNFGQLGERPTHPELLDYLAARLMEQNWSMKALHREIVLSTAYRLSAATDESNFARDPDNRYLWRANRRRLDIEPLRDTLLQVSGQLDRTVGGAPVKLTNSSNRRRSVYGFVSRRKLDGTLSLFDFPNPNSMSEQRIETATPLQQLYFLNSGFVEDRAIALACRVEGSAFDTAGRIRAAYRMVYGRAPSKEEIALGEEYVSRGDDPWVRYAQVLLSSNELLFVD
ncbi:MAG: PSD1 and planctomycete cytochrome C domain-containing protein [Bryobacteraceae bacterium]